VDNQNLEYNLPTQAYVNFDALSLKAYMIEQLNKNGKFTDQNYEGSNLAAILDILAYYTHVLMFYLNQTSSESMFSQTTIYENMNKIVKLIGYKPTGKQTSLCPITCSTNSNLLQGSYYIRKYSYFLVDNIQYNILNDHTFEKITNGVEDITSINNQVVLYQGTISEYPTYTVMGDEYETFPIVVDNLVNTNDNKFISHGTISVYVKETSTDSWYEYIEVDSLFLTNSTDRVYDLRLNENGHYEVKFGNGIFGKKLEKDDQVSVFYILSDGDRGQISKGSINGNKLFVYNNSRFNEIYDDITNDNLGYLINQTYSGSLTFRNPSNSTSLQDAETVDDIRENTPVFLSSQLRLVTEFDYEKYLKKSIPNILNDVKVVDNNVFIGEYINYFYTICVDPNKVNRVLLNQVNFADSCDFNNVNIFCVPTFTILEDEQYPDYLNNSYKTLIKDITKDKKMISNEVVPRDPIYMALDFGYTQNTVSKNIFKTTKLVLVREKNNKKNKEQLKSQIVSIILDYFSPTNIKLGQRIDMSDLTSRILGIDGVKNLRTVNSDGSILNGLSFVIWNPMFEGVDEQLITQTTTMEFFKYPYIYRPKSLINRIDIIDE
jgi:hypothetical protein